MLDGAGEIEDLYDIIQLRASFLIGHAIDGMNLSFDKALSIIRNHNNGLTDHEEKQRKILLAAIDNLVDFAAAEEYQMINSLPDELSEDDIESYEDECEKYNLTYASQENADVMYAGKMAISWMLISEGALITYMTQRDERVRESHAVLDGATYTKATFPEELIPPIDWACRCYLDVPGSVIASVNALTKKDIKKAVNPVFKGSLAKYGPIFSEKHSYFNISKSDKKRLDKISNSIKQKFYK